MKFAIKKLYTITFKLKNQDIEIFFPGACHQLKDFEAKMGGFENRIAEYMEVFEKWKRRKPPFAAQKPIIDDPP